MRKGRTAEELLAIRDYAERREEAAEGLRGFWAGVYWTAHFAAQGLTMFPGLIGGPPALDLLAGVGAPVSWDDPPEPVPVDAETWDRVRRCCEETGRPLVGDVMDAGVYRIAFAPPAAGQSDESRERMRRMLEEVRSRGS